MAPVVRSRNVCLPATWCTTVVVFVCCIRLSSLGAGGEGGLGGRPACVPLASC